MPKQALHINRFEGGMNTDFAPEDIPNNSLLDALGISVSNIGRIVMPGDPHASSGITSQDRNDGGEAPGYGLFSFSSDYAQDNSEAATKYLAMQDGSYTKIWDGTNWNAHGSVSFDNGATNAAHATEPSFYAPNGDLRVCDGKFSHANNFDNNVKWFGYIPKKAYGVGIGGLTAATIGGWNVQDASIEGGYPKSSSGIATNAFMRNVTDAHAGTGSSGLYRSEINYNAEGGTADSTKYAGWLASESGNVSASGAKWGARLEFVESATLGSGTWMATASESYKFYASFVYNDGQESNPVLFNMMPTLYNLDNAGTSDQIKFADRNTTSFYKSYILSVASSGTVATITCNQSHGMSNGDYVIIEGSDDLSQSNFDGIYAISGVSGADFNVDVSDPIYGSPYSAIGTNAYAFTDATCDYNNDPTIAHDDDSGKIKAGYLVTGTGIPSTNPAYVGVHTSDTEFELYDTNDGEEISTTGGSVTNGTLTFQSRNVCVTKVGTNIGIYFTPQFKINYQDDNTVSLFGAPTITSTSGGNKRIIGSRIYYSASNEGFGNLWLMFDCNFEKGVKAFGIGETLTVTDYMPWQLHQTAADTSAEKSIRPQVTGDGENIFKHPPKYETYESLNGYSHDSKLDAKWKTAVIANGRAYIANVKRRQKATFNVNDTALTAGKQAWSSTVTDDPTFGDRILKSPVDRFDTFPEEMAIELFGGDDGDQIVKLETFADRIFVFKRNTLHIINIAKDVEILESSHKGMGLDGGIPCQSCLTRNGIAWMNSSGVYHYNGESIESLTDNKIDSFWKGKVSSYFDQDTVQVAFWLSDAVDVPSIGYDIESNKLIIHKTSSDAGDDEEDILIYDMKIKAWTWLNEAMDNEKRTNMVNYDGKLIYHEDDSGTDVSKKYNDTPHPPGHDATGAGEALRVYTKPYDFGTPLQRKKIYKVYVTYRCSGDTGNGDDPTNIHIKYYVNGDVNTTYQFTTGAGNNFNSDDDNIALDTSVAELDTTEGIWETAALKPATSSEANNIKSFGLLIFNDSGQVVDKDFEINDITIIYRTKSVK